MKFATTVLFYKNNFTYCVGLLCQREGGVLCHKNNSIRIRSWNYFYEEGLFCVERKNLIRFTHEFFPFEERLWG
jgi:hypothetical protein